jgi:peptide deformylase
LLTVDLEKNWWWFILWILFIEIMAHLKVETGEQNEILRQKSLPVKKVDKEIIKLIKSMAETMELESGCGLAAPQVGVHKRVIVVLLNQSTDSELIIGMINPEITFFSTQTNIDTEGCLSLPQYFDEVERANDIIVKFLDMKGKEQMLKLTDLNARVIQHEIDHLDGVLFADRVVGGVPAELVMNKSEKQLKL